MGSQRVGHDWATELRHWLPSWAIGHFLSLAQFSWEPSSRAPKPGLLKMPAMSPAPVPCHGRQHLTYGVFSEPGCLLRSQFGATLTGEKHCPAWAIQFRHWPPANVQRTGSPSAGSGSRGSADGSLEHTQLAPQPSRSHCLQLSLKTWSLPK